MATSYVSDGVAKMAPFKYSSVIFNYLVDIIFFGYTFTTSDSIGTTIIVIALLAPSIADHYKIG